jgi:hypothetical protein
MFVEREAGWMYQETSPTGVSCVAQAKLRHRTRQTRPEYLRISIPDMIMLMLHL